MINWDNKTSSFLASQYHNWKEEENEEADEWFTRIKKTGNRKDKKEIKIIQPLTEEHISLYRGSTVT